MHLPHNLTDSEEILAHNSGLESDRLEGVVSNSHMHQGSRENRWKECAIYEMIRGRLYFTAHSDDLQTVKAIRDFPQRYYFSNYLPETYCSFCLDFGPTSMANIVRFCSDVHEKFEHPRLAQRAVVYYCDAEEASFTNSILMLAAYLLLIHGHTAQDALLPFARIVGLPIKKYRDATWCDPTFGLHLEWCIRGLSRAKELGWIDAATFDVDNYERFDCPASFNANKITPKFIAFAGPVAKRPGMDWNEYMHEPEEFVEEFKKRGVSTVVRLNEPSTYDKAVFERAGIHVVDLEFRDCTTPSVAIIKGFLDTVDSAEGVVAVHCLAGLGRTGTLIAIHMMKHNGFSGLEAMGLMRLMRPGSVIGPQQEFLKSMDNAVWDGNLIVSGANMGLVDLNSSREMAEQVKNASRGNRRIVLP